MNGLSEIDIEPLQLANVYLICRESKNKRSESVSFIVITSCWLALYLATVGCHVTQPLWRLFGTTQGLELTRLCQSNKYAILGKLACCGKTKQIFLEQISDRIFQPFLKITVSVYPTACCTTQCKMTMLQWKQYSSWVNTDKVWNCTAAIYQAKACGRFFFPYMLAF